MGNNPAFLFNVIIVVITFIFGFISLTEKEKQKKILSAVLLCTCCYYLLAISSSITYPYGFYIMNMLIFLIMPILYIYTKCLVQINFTFRRKYFLHFTPPFIALLFLILARSILSEYFSNTLQHLIIVSLYAAQVLSYSLAIFLLLRKHTSNIKNNFSFYLSNNNLKWLKVYLFIYLFIINLDFIFVFIIRDMNFLVSNINYIHISNSIYIVQHFILGFFGFKQKAIYSNCHKKIDNSIIKKEAVEKDLESSKKTKTNIDTKSIYNKLKDHIITDKLYINPELSLFSISRDLNINRTYLSISIKEEANSNFYSLINTMRVAEAKKLIRSNSFQKHTIDSISKQSGFKSKATFYFWFKKETGKTPLQYKNETLQAVN